MRITIGRPTGARRGLGTLCAVAVGLLLGCNTGDEDECLGLCGESGESPQDSATPTDGGSGPSSTGESAGVTSGSSSGDDPDFIFDLGSLDVPDDNVDCEGEECTCVLNHSPCDAGTDDPFAAIGVNCPGEAEFTTSTRGPTGPYDYYGQFETLSGAIGVRSSFGGTDKFSPREGESYAVLSTGFVASLDLPDPPPGWEFMYDCNDDLGDEFDPGALLDPIDFAAVDCAADPGVIGEGDCSGTLQEQFEQGAGWYDWVDMQIGGFVPEDATSFSFDFAFFTYEYPEYFETQFNDIFIGWLESENWTGNISFDGQGKPISLNASFLDFKDDDADAPEFEGTCMQGHAGTNWLTTSVGVTPGEYVRIAFVLLDMSDSALDSAVFIDNVSWGCDDVGGPVTEPAG